MEEIIVGNEEQLYENVKGQDVYIYGAKTVAMRTCKSIEMREGGHVLGYVVSNRYDNPRQLYGKPVYRIEEENIHYDCMVLAVKSALLWKVRDEIAHYDIDKLILISSFKDDAFFNGAGKVLSDKSRISGRICIANDAQIVADVTSSVIIEDGVVIGKGCVILAANNSHVHIGRRSNICDEVCVIVGDNSIVELKNGVCIGKTGRISIGGFGEINIEEGTTFGNHLFMIGCRSQINIGEDCMFSDYIKINVGNHKLIDKNDGTEITNRTPIIIGNHVWCGMGAALLPGCKIGNGSVVGASALVNKEIPSNCTCAGIPAKVLRRDVEWFR